MTVAVRHLAVPREHRLITQGQVVNLLADIADVGLVSALLDPTNTPTLSLFDPVDTLLIANADMFRLSKGQYNYEYQTTTANPLGVYTVDIIVRHLTTVARLERVAVFKIIKAISPASIAAETFTYFAIKDQNSNIWYWYVAADNTLNFSPTIPVVTGRTAQAILIDPIPYWLEIQNATPATRYVYPVLSGEVTVSATQPALGTGSVGSPLLMGVSGGNYAITVNVLDEEVTLLAI